MVKMLDQYRFMLLVVHRYINILLEVLHIEIME